MLRKFRILIMNHLGFSVKEANGTLVLMLLLSVIIFTPWLYHAVNKESPAVFESDQEDILKWKATFEVTKAELSSPRSVRTYGAFDPNKVSQEIWVEMGVTPHIAERIIKYQTAGGKFNTPKDLYKIYGIDSGVVQALLPNIVIPEIKEKQPLQNFKKPRATNQAEISSKPSIIKKPINRANAEDLKKIYGIGDKLSGRIVKYRDALGGFHAIDQLTEVYFFQDSLLPKVASMFSFDSLQLTKLHINLDSVHTLKSHPYLSYNQARAIFNYREVHGVYKQVEDIKAIKILPDSTFDKLKPYISLKE